jgi:GntR family transcriptional regulator of arabinose operon
VNLSNSEPLYKQIMKKLLDDIKQGVFKPEDKLPSESEIIEEFGVSRITARQAIKELVNEGLVYQVQGKGTFVKAPVIEKESITGKYISLIVPYVDAPHMSGFFAEIEVYAKSYGYNMILCNSHENPVEEQRYLQQFREQGVNGVILYPTSQSGSRAVVEEQLKEELPLVLVDRYFPELHCSYVVSDNYKGAYEIVTHMLSKGYKRIAFVTHPNMYLSSCEDRYKGYQAALEDYKLSCNEKILFLSGTPEDRWKKVQHFLQQHGHLDAVFALNEQVALAVLKAVHEMGLEVPGEIGIGCFDGYGAAVPVNMTLTSANQQVRLIAKKAVEVLVATMNGQITEPRQFVIPPEICIGNTT